MRRYVWAMLGGSLAVAVAGCAAPGKTLPVSLSVAMAAGPPPALMATEPLRVAVVTLEDRRPEPATVGRWQHYVESQVDRLVPVKGSPAEQVSDFVAEYLQRAGFQTLRVSTPQDLAPEAVDVVLTGEIQSYWSEAVRRLARTELSAKNRLAFRVVNTADRSRVDVGVEGEESAVQLAFDLRDLEKLTAGALGESLARFLARLSVVDRTLKTRRGG